MEHQSLPDWRWKEVGAYAQDIFQSIIAHVQLLASYINWSKTPKTTSILCHMFGCPWINNPTIRSIINIKGLTTNQRMWQRWSVYHVFLRTLFSNMTNFATLKAFDFGRVPWLCPPTFVTLLLVLLRLILLIFIIFLGLCPNIRLCLNPDPDSSHDLA